jgi:hypothetical protein
MDIIYSEKQHNLWPVFQKTGQKNIQVVNLDDPYHHWLQTEVQDVNMPDSEVDVYNDTHYGLQTEAQDRTVICTCQIQMRPE